MSFAKLKQPISIPDYLNGEITSSIKHEFVDGMVYAMAGATVNHNRIATNVTVTVSSQLRGKRCQVFNSDMKVRVRMKRSTRFYYPDVSVVCQPNAGDETFQYNPVVIVEVVSESTRRIDEHEKREAYLSINSLCAYVLLEPNTAAALVYRRADAGFTQEAYGDLDAIIPLPEIECNLSLAEAYAQVQFLLPDLEG